MTDLAYGIPLVELPSYRRKKPLTEDQVTETHDGINFELLDEILKFITEHPRQWEQGSWYATVDRETGKQKLDFKIETVEEVNSCGSSFCFAGHVALREGFPSPPLRNNQEWERTVKNPNYDPQSRDWMSDSREKISESVSEFAMKRLGLDSDVADELFDGDNTLEDIQAMVVALHLLPNISWARLSEIRNADPDEKLSIIAGLVTYKQ